MEQKELRFYRDKRWTIVVRFLERRLNHNRRIIPGTLLERFVKVQAELIRRGRVLEIYHLYFIVPDADGNRFVSVKYLSRSFGIPVGTIKQTRRRLRRVEAELEERGELYPTPSYRNKT